MEEQIQQLHEQMENSEREHNEEFAKLEGDYYEVRWKYFFKKLEGDYYQVRWKYFLRSWKVITTK